MNLFKTKKGKRLKIKSLPFKWVEDGIRTRDPRNHKPIL